MLLAAFPEYPEPYKLAAYLRSGLPVTFWQPDAKRPVGISYLEFFNFDFNLWSKLSKEIENPIKRKEWIKNGSLILKYEDKRIEEIIAEGGELVQFEGRKIFAVNSILFRSELGNLLCRRHPPFAIIWRKESDSLKFSLRGNGSIDVSKIAKKYGGGGHFSAASFRLPPDSKLPWLIKNKF